MQSVSSLRDTINKQHTDAESKRILANSLIKSAAQHEADGDDVRAKLDRDSAERYLRDADVIEKNIADYESEIIKREQKAQEIEKRIAALNERYEHDLGRLENDKKSIKVDIIMGNEASVMMDTVKNKRIDNKEEELQKNHDRELQKLIDEHKLVLG